MNRDLFKRVVCVVLALMMFGCKSTYDLTLYSTPPGVVVEVGPDLQGRTPCNLEIPKKSKLIHDNIIDVKFILEDGRNVVKSYDLRNYEPPKPSIGETVGGCIAAPGLLLIALVSKDKDKDEEERSRNSFFYKVDKEREREERKERKEKTKYGLIGVGFIAAGGLIAHLFGGNKGGKQYKYDIRESFEDVNGLANN